MTGSEVKTVEDFKKEFAKEAKDKQTAKNIEGFSEGLNTLTGSEVKTVEDYKLEFAKDAALKEFDKYGVSDFYKKMIEKAGTVEGVKQLQSEVVEAAKANRIQEGTEGLVDFLKEQTPAEETVKAIELAEAKAMALKEFDKYGVSDFYKKMIEKAGTVEGVKQLQSEVVEAAKANRIQEGTEGLVDFLKEQTLAEDTIKSIKLSEAKAAAKAELKAAGVSDFFISKIDGAKTVEGVKALKELILSSLAKPETDKPETEKPEADKPEADKPEAEKPGTEKPGAEKPGTDKPGIDKPEAGKSVPMTKLTPAKPAAPKAMAPKAAANQLPSTGEATNPFFTAAAMAVMAGAGMVAFSAKRKED
ncbi:albumin-binding GA domain-containing protein [Streptococcus phocae]|uniref:albumin-binding GA domain-containing protein n=1 Tax=Streptococcus phocae TaxID=119224 RepID=UPI000691A021|nr:albumin-binding GA domain-containing protein [Streptococcus phocae]